jgi:hypothetical protein
MRRPEPVEGRRLGLSKGAVRSLSKGAGLSLSKGHREVARLCR